MCYNICVMFFFEISLKFSATIPHPLYQLPEAGKIQLKNNSEESGSAKTIQLQATIAL